MLFHSVDGADIWVVQRRSGARFALEALHGRPFAGQFFRQELQSDASAKLDVFCFVNHAHAAAPKISSTR